ncbi:MAG TPA: TAXI family TRAP transporter solute-binding subunit [Thermodesulfobacteriota bacterium]|nr:TAXI family TRAP transporter solute-binding subunit [Thermodesulfobacteriota bacterium]
MRKKCFVGILVLCLVIFFSSFRPEFAHSAKKYVTIASGWVVGVYFPLAGALSRIAHEKLPEIKITVESSGASVANAKLIGTGDADMAILQNDIAFYALKGVKPMFDKPVSNIRGIASLYQEHCQIQARKDAKIMTVRDLRGKRVCVGPLGSGTEQNAMQILEVYGMKFEDLAKVERLTAAEASDYLKDSRIDAAFYSVGVGASALVDTAMMTDTLIVPIEDAQADMLIKKYPFFSKANVPKGSYKGVDKDVPTVAVLAILVARAEMEEEMVYKITKAMFENIKDIERAHAKGKEVKLETALVGMPIPIHPGAERYFKEKGIKK